MPPEHWPRIGVISPSSPSGPVERARGIRRLRDSGFDVVMHPQCDEQHFTFAGTLEQRAAAFFEYAMDDSIDVLWCARGGNGATRLLPALDLLAETRGVPSPKLLVGYSDITALHAYTRERWGWRTLHASMPGSDSFSTMNEAQFKATLGHVRGCASSDLWHDKALTFMGDTRRHMTGPLEGMVVGGNLSVWQYLMGTNYHPVLPLGTILFLEDVNEGFYRIDEMITHIAMAGGLDHIAAIVLGDFTKCDDSGGKVRISEDGDEKRPLRRNYTFDEAMHEVWGTIGDTYRIPIAYGLPIGHGEQFAPLALGATYRLNLRGQLHFVHWDDKTR